MRNLFLALFAVAVVTLSTLAGCAATGNGTRGGISVPPPVRAGTTPQKWEYACVGIKWDEPMTVTRVANRFGAAGWEMANVVGGGSASTDVWCFKRRLP